LDAIEPGDQRKQRALAGALNPNSTVKIEAASVKLTPSRARGASFTERLEVVVALGFGLMTPHGSYQNAVHHLHVKRFGQIAISFLEYKDRRRQCLLRQS
jgi:hypothetical protein